MEKIVNNKKYFEFFLASYVYLYKRKNASQNN